VPTLFFLSATAPPMKSLFPFLFCLVSLSKASGAIQIIDQDIQPPGEYQKRPVPFLVDSAGTKVMLPLETLYYGRVSNADKSIVAINFKAATDYDGVDLLIERGHRIYVLNNIWLNLNVDVERSKIVPNASWDKRMQLEVKSIHGNRLTCWFRGENSKEPFFVERTFYVDVTVENDAISFRVSK